MASHNPVDLGIVTSVQGKAITVEIVKGGGCKACGLKGLCGTDNNPIIMHFDTDDSYQIGDKVIVSVSAGVRVLSSLIVFIFPLLAMFGFYFAGRCYTTESGSILIAFGGLLLAFGIIRILDKRIGRKINFSLGGRYEDLSE